MIPKALLLSHISIRLDNYKANLAMPNPDWPQDVQKALFFIHKNLFNQWLTATKVKCHCCIANNNFSTKFKIHVGSGIKEYILENRLLASSLLLRSCKFNCASNYKIAVLIGFSSISSFFQEKIWCFSNPISNLSYFRIKVK